MNASFMNEVLRRATVVAMLERDGGVTDEDVIDALHSFSTPRAR